jgi:hypothetical protein
MQHVQQQKKIYDNVIPEVKMQIDYSKPTNS